MSKQELLGSDINKVKKIIKKETGIMPILFSSFSKEGLDKLISVLFEECKKEND